MLSWKLRIRRRLKGGCCALDRLDKETKGHKEFER